MIRETTRIPLSAGDRAPVSTTAFGEVFKAEGLRIITTLPKTPRMNAVCERVTGTLRRKLLDRILIAGERHLAMVLREYAAHYNGHMPHQPRRQRSPDIGWWPPAWQSPGRPTGFPDDR